VAEHLGLQNHEVVVDRESFLEMLPEAVRTSDEPLSDLTIVPLLAVARLARGHVKVALSGEGSDEILAGYNFQDIQRKYETIKQIQRLPSSVIVPISRVLRLVSARSGDKLDQIATIPLPQWNLALRNYMSLHWEHAEKPRLWPIFDGSDSDSILKSMYAAAKSQDPLDQLLSVSQKSWLVEDLLMKADKMSMATSLEVRVPFLDYRIVEWANRQPIGVKIGRVGRRTVTKRVLRRFANGRLPQEIIDRPKRGFPVPVTRWLADDPLIRSWAVEHIAGKQSRIKYLFQPQEMERQLRLAATGDLKAADKVWVLIVLETWLRAFDVDVTAEMDSASDVAIAADF
jgi:asparagine synthase (glutamine-hydrolysing)